MLASLALGTHMRCVLLCLPISLKENLHLSNKKAEKSLWICSALVSFFFFFFFGAPRPKGKTWKILSIFIPQRWSRGRDIYFVVYDWCRSHWKSHEMRQKGAGKMKWTYRHFPSIMLHRQDTHRSSSKQAAWQKAAEEIKLFASTPSTLGLSLSEENCDSRVDSLSLFSLSVYLSK